MDFQWYNEVLISNVSGRQTKRTAQTLRSLIERHVAPGSRIFSDNWAAYLHLNELGYEYCLATHKSSFKQSYRNVQTGQTELKEHNKYLKITLEELMGRIRQIVSYICLKLFGGTMCIMKIFMINSSNQ